MGREAYLFSLENNGDDFQGVLLSLQLLDYSVIKKNEMGLFLEKKLPCGFIEVNINDTNRGSKCFIRIAKLNLEEIISMFLKDIKKVKEQFPNLSLYDVESKLDVDLDDEQALIRRFLNAQKEFVLYFPTLKKTPIRCEEVFYVKYCYE